MRICMISYDIQGFGGLEEYAVNLSIGLQQEGHDVSYLTPTWISPANQYMRRLRSNNITLVQPAKWVSQLISDWPTKEKILRVAMLLFAPLVFFLGVGLSIVKRRSPKLAWRSSHNWLKGQLMDRLIGPDRRKFLGQILLNWWTFRWHPDILHVHDFSNNLLFVMEWGHARKVPVIYEEHATPDPHFDQWKRFHHDLNLAASVVAVSEKSAQALCEVCGVPHPLVVRGPILPDPFTPGWQGITDRRRNGSSVTITTIARLFPMKGLDYLLEAAALVRKTRPDAQFRIYGDGELRDELLAKAKGLGLVGEDMFMGTFEGREELACIMSNTDIFLLSSILEGQPVVIVEAMAYSCPIVATAVGGVPELIQDGVNGLLCKPADAQCLAQKVQMLIEDPALRARLGAAARASYEQGPFQVRSVTANFVSIYSEALRRQNSK